MSGRQEAKTAEGAIVRGARARGGNADLASTFGRT